MVTPAWPPTTGTVTSTGSTRRISATNASARTTSSFVTPSSLSGLYVPAVRYRHVPGAEQLMYIKNCSAPRRCACNL